MTDKIGKEKEINYIEDFDRAVELTRQNLTKKLNSTPRHIREYTSHLGAVQGKLIRALSLLACAEFPDGRISEEAVHSAVGVELLHLATLVHDDVIDDSRVRRGIATLNKKYDRKTAVICGDYLLCLALEQGRHLKYRDIDLSDYMTSICLGELRQHQNNFNFELSPVSYFRIIKGKTAALFEASFFAGAVLCDESIRQQKIYLRLGNYLGMIFQLMDDCIDFEESIDIAKKPVQSDFEQGVITLPMIHALQNDLELKNLSVSEIVSENIFSAVKRAGSLAFTKGISKRYYKKALKLIENLNASDSKKDRIKLLFDMAYNGLSAKKTK